MRKWFKYSLSQINDRLVTKSQDSSFSEHAEAMGGYEVDDAYNSKNAFFRKYYDHYHLGRLEDYDKFLRKHIDKKDRILSVASGRSANELRLLEDGYDISCTDLDLLPCYDDTLKLFPNYRFSILNILEKPADNQFDTVICLSLIYLFDEKQLDVFFKNISRSLTEHGYLLIDSAGSPDNLLSFLIHDVLLKIEVHILKSLILLKSLGKKKFGITKKTHGYRRTNTEIIDIAKNNGFELIDLESYAFLTEFKRSRILLLIMKVPFVKVVFRIIGKNVPYIRMFYFKKIRG